MERLTERTKYGIVGNNNGVENFPLYSLYDETHLDHGLIEQCFNKLAEYEDAEEQGLLLRLPCKVGDTIYRINQYAKEPIVSMKVLQVRFGELYIGNKFLRIDAINDEDMGEFCYLQSEFGKNVFFTKEEAEQALAKMKEV